MPAYNFQRQFIGKILDGSKPHTIRRRRKHPTKVDDTIMMFCGLRTKNCFQFAEAPCVKITPVIIFPWKAEIWKADDDKRGAFRTMKSETVNELARADGFDTVAEFFEFFKLYKTEALDDFEIIYWDPKQLKKIEGAS